MTIPTEREAKLRGGAARPSVDHHRAWVVHEPVVPGLVTPDLGEPRAAAGQRAPLLSTAPPGHRLPGVWSNLRLGLAAGLLVLAFDSLFMRDGTPEGLLLRWIRVAAQHPVRIGLAANLLAWCLKPASTIEERSPRGEAGKIVPYSL